MAYMIRRPSTRDGPPAHGYLGRTERLFQKCRHPAFHRGPDAGPRKGEEKGVDGAETMLPAEEFADELRKRDFVINESLSYLSD